LTGLDFEVAHQQRQDPLADAAEPDDDEPSGEGSVLLIQHGNRAIIGLTGSAYGRRFLLSSQRCEPNTWYRDARLATLGGSSPQRWVRVYDRIGIHKIA
jgi:hypothetical protein